MRGWRRVAELCARPEIAAFLCRPLEGSRTPCEGPGGFRSATECPGASLARPCSAWRQGKPRAERLALHATTHATVCDKDSSRAMGERGMSSDMWLARWLMVPSGHPFWAVYQLPPTSAVGRTFKGPEALRRQGLSSYLLCLSPECPWGDKGVGCRACHIQLVREGCEIGQSVLCFLLSLGTTVCTVFEHSKS